MTLEQASLFGARALPRGNSQCGKILAALHAAGGAWLSMPELVEISDSYNIHSRIDELRHAYGFNIENQTDYSVRPHRSKYRLLPAAQEAA